MKNILPHWINHIIVSILISIAVNSPYAGAFFYIGREWLSWEKRRNIQLLDVVPPVVINAIIYVYLMGKETTIWTIISGSLL